MDGEREAGVKSRRGLSQASPHIVSLDYLVPQPGQVVHPQLVLAAIDADQNVEALQHLNLREPSARDQGKHCRAGQGRARGRVGEEGGKEGEETDSSDSDRCQRVKWQVHLSHGRCGPAGGGHCLCRPAG